MLADHGRNIGASAKNIVEGDEQLVGRSLLEHVTQGAGPKGFLDVSRVGVHGEKH